MNRNVRSSMGGLDLIGRIAFVTGSAGGLGAAIAVRLAQAGADVALGDIRPTHRVATSIQALGRKSLELVTDVADVNSISRSFDRIEHDWEPVDLLINTVGIYPTTRLLDIDPGEWDQVVHTNLRSAFLTSQQMVRRLLGTGKPGAILNIGSIEAVNPAVGHSHYAASKAGLVMLGRTAALEWGELGIRVNTVSPALLDRPNLAHDWPEGVERFLSRAPLARLGHSDDIAEACIFLASDRASWITGAHLIADGGVLCCQAY